jgi:ureidoglycolate lyase
MATASTVPTSSRVVIEPLTRAAFASFGLVIETGSISVPANGGTARRHDAGDLARDERSGARLLLSVFDCEPQAFPLRLNEMERHEHSAQTIAPMSGGSWVVVVCPSGRGGMPDLDGLRAFKAQGHQGVTYHPGIWHHGIIALDRQSLFFVQSWQDGSAADCEIRPVGPIRVEGSHV